MKNTIQIIGLCIYNFGLLVYAAVQKNQITDSVRHLAEENDLLPTSHIARDTRPFLVALPCLVALGTLLLSIVAWKLYDEFAWSIYKHISADLRMKRRYLTFQVSFRFASTGVCQFNDTRADLSRPTRSTLLS